MPVILECVICESRFSVIPSRVQKGAKYCSYRCHQIGEGRKGGRVRGKQMKKSSRHKSYPKKNGIHFHRTVAEKILNRKLRKGEVIHHKDGNRLNNDCLNIEITTQSNHIKKHLPGMLKKRREKHGY